MILHNSGKEDVTILTCHGYLTITRTILRPKDPDQIKKLKDSTGKKSVVPLDIALGIDELPYKITRQMMLQITRDAISARSYQEVEERYKAEKDIEISSDQIRLVTDYVGDRVVKQDKERARNALNSLDKDRKSRKSGRDSVGVLYLMMDGAHILTVEEGWKEVKTAMVFSSKQLYTWKNRNTGEECRKILQKDFVSCMDSASVFKGHVAALFKRNNGHKFKEVVVIGDGADWIQNIADEICPDSVRILDLAHLKGKVGTFGKQIFGDKPEGKEWIDNVCKMLEDGKWEEVLQLPEVVAHRDDKTTGGKVNLHLYINDRKSSLDYPKYKEKGYFVGSGAMESANKYVPQERLKLTGMRWKIISVRRILSLRAREKSKKWHEVEKIVENALYS
ncbi:MAG: hypothetical protein IJ088_00385 [Clostridia bacterium]|nr:hypothetical protein [Clostridia bacterium]